MAAKIILEQRAHPRSWTETQTIEAYLTSNNIPHTTAKPLAGGLSAYVWRIEGYYDDSTRSKGQSCVLKYAEEMARVSPHVTLDAKRMLFEARALASQPVAEACRAEPSVQVPSVLRTTENAILMSWAGDIDLRSAYMDEKLDFDVAKVGARLGRWIAAMHIAGLHDSEVSTWTQDITEKLTAAEVAHLRQTMAADGMEAQAVKDTVQMRVLPAGPRTLIQWDFRPMNTLLRFDDSNSGSLLEEPSLTVVDWECARYGCPADDLRVWVAEGLVLEAEHGAENSMVSSFLAAYRSQVGGAIVTEDLVCKLALSVGSMMFRVVPSGLWTSDPGQIEFWIARAMQFVRAASRRDLPWLSASEFAPLFPISKI